LGKFWDGKSSVLLGSSGGKWGKSDHEEMESWERNQVDGHLSEIAVKLSWESEAASDSTHGGRDEMVEISVCWGSKFEGSEADVIKGFVIDNLDLIGVLNELMDGESGVVWLNNGIGDLWGWED
jgi:hypothetical protein